ncbi:hypothetical protein WJX72_008751 [[Myrmecia] bisecta]|uniref:BTB domain-containing protein n=1 Tax=[Myrmecia] bisecta TaxID=41462 RepID=A0AAW1R852_9CHLO
MQLFEAFEGKKAAVVREDDFTPATMERFLLCLSHGCVELDCVCNSGSSQEAQSSCRAASCVAKVASQDDAISLLKCADKYGVEWLKEWCETDLVQRHLTKQSLVLLLQLASQYNCHVLWRECTKFMGGAKCRLSTCLALPAFVQLFKDLPELATKATAEAAKQLEEDFGVDPDEEA